MDTRRGKEDYYLDIADAVLNRSTCLRRKYGAIIVRNDEILSTGYNGAPRGRPCPRSAPNPGREPGPLRRGGTGLRHKRLRA